MGAGPPPGGGWRPQRPLRVARHARCRSPRRAPALVEHAFRTFPSATSAPRRLRTVYQVRLGDVGRTWEVHCTETAARVRRGATGP